MIYDNLTNKIAKVIPQQKFKFSFINGPKVEVLDENQNNKYLIKFIDNQTNFTHYETTLVGGHWGSSSLEYYIEWRIEIYDKNNHKIYEYLYNAHNKKVFISFESKALGDTLSWFPYVEEFRNKHKCEVVVSTFHNNLFKEKYPKIEFVEKGNTVHNLYAQYNIGCFYNDEKINYNKVPINFKLNTLGRICSSTLGLEYKEIKPKLTFKNTGSTIEGEYIVIAPHGSAHAKYWNYKGGWQTVIDYLNNKGYKVVMITQELLGDKWHDSKLGGTLTGVIDKTGNYPLSERANDLLNAKAFIGISSGLSWLSWSLNCPTTIISGFTQPLTEMESCNRIFTPSPEICSGCFSYHKLDAGDWEWCPEHKGTSRQFECTKKILPSTVIQTINTQLDIS